MTAPEEPIGHCDLPLDEAVESLTGFETIEIQKHYKADLSDLGGVRLSIGVVHALENRDGRRRSWQAVEALTLKQLNAYFERTPSDPDSDLGKDSNDDA